MPHTVLAPICSRGGTVRRGCGGSPRSGSPSPAAAPAARSSPLRWDGHAGWVGPAAPNQVAMPAQQRGPLHQPSLPHPAGQQPRKPGQHRAVGPVDPGPGPPVGAAPRPRAATPAAPRPWSPSAAPTAQTIPTAGRRSDRAVVALSTDHLDQRLPRRTHSSERTTDFLQPRWRCRSLRSPVSSTTSTPPSWGAVAGSSHNNCTRWSLTCCGVPGRLREEPLQPLDLAVLGPGDRLGPGQPGQGLVAIARQQQAVQIVTQTAALSQAREQDVEPLRIGLQRAGRGWARTAGAHRWQWAPGSG